MRIHHPSIVIIVHSSAPFSPSSLSTEGLGMPTCNCTPLCSYAPAPSETCTLDATPDEMGLHAEAMREPVRGHNAHDAGLVIGKRGFGNAHTDG